MHRTCIVRDASDDYTIFLDSVRYLMPYPMSLDKAQRFYNYLKECGFVQGTDFSFFNCSGGELQVNKESWWQLWFTNSKAAMLFSLNFSLEVVEINEDE